MERPLEDQLTQREPETPEITTDEQTRRSTGEVEEAQRKFKTQTRAESQMN